MFFGAGNLIFLPALGRVAENKILFSIIGFLIIGPLFAIPRTAATTFELGIHPLILLI
ncbi:branched-chain amino acid transport system II carrier protein [uncultured Clostridium sp.]|uniref:branched-chain amino acid transport system II carrier protein n=1 Tax=uncultured Clostridium sp. TaxID=59620 RepID=UPI002614953F|nr:branched-chain amino acid transport system II carrier protein [uncultured Clostridium sp.]